VVRATLIIMQLYCVVRGVYCGYSNNNYSAMLLCCVRSLLWLQQQYILCNIALCCMEIFEVTTTLVIVQWYFVCMEFILFKSRVDIVQ